MQMNNINHNKGYNRKAITDIDDLVAIYFESGCARIRFKEGVTLESLLTARK